MKLNKHGLKIQGLRKLAGVLKQQLPPRSKHTNYNGACVQLYYSKHNGAVWSMNYQKYTKGLERSVFADTEVIMVCLLFEQRTMQQLADIIERKLNFIAECERMERSNELPF